MNKDLILKQAYEDYGQKSSFYIWLKSEKDRDDMMKFLEGNPKISIAIKDEILNNEVFKIYVELRNGEK